MTISIAIIFGWLIVTTVVGVLAGRNQAFSMENYFVGGRSFGTFLFYTTAAAEIYSAFAFLGLAGWAYSKGMSIVYAMAYGSIAYGLYFFIGPRINRLGARLKYISQPDFIADRYESRWLGVFVAFIGVIFSIPYLQLQIMGAGMIVQLASGGAISWQIAVIISFIAAVIFVYVSGLRGIGWTNFLQAIIMLFGMVSIGFIFPNKFFGGTAKVWEILQEIKPSHLTLPDSAGLGIFWVASVSLICGLGFWMWPHIFTATYAAKSEKVVRRNATILPLYSLTMIPIMVVGFTCAAKAGVDPSFAGTITKPDHAMLIALVNNFPPLLAGFIGAGGLAASISTSSGLILTSSNLMARNVIQKGFMPGMEDMAVARLGRALVPVLTVLAVLLAIFAPSMLVSLLLVGYSGVTQFFPAVVLGLFAKWPTKAGIVTGLLAGLATVVAIKFMGVPSPMGLHEGFVGLIVNFAVVMVVSSFTPKISPSTIDRFESTLR